MTGFWATVSALVWKDIRAELRTKDVVISVLTFALLSLVIFNFALRPSPQVIPIVAPGVLWVAFTFAGVLGLTRTFVLEKDRGNLEGLLLTPTSREAIYVGKMLGSLVFMLVAEVVVLPLFAVLFNLSPFRPGLLLVMLLTTIGFTAVGTLFSAIAINTRSREIMLPMLLLPLVVPVIIAAVVASGTALEGGSWSEMAKWLQLIAVFDVLALVFSAFAFEQVLQE
ncbi:MAG: cytochrome c-type biosis protein CcmB [Dehalococcoidia bacterium]|nr:cytochrome c-type biosis protein CcmB [Dehalococcoidia bacterium]